MRESLLLVGILMMTVAFTGCQQTGLTEEEIRRVVQEEGSALQTEPTSAEEQGSAPEIGETGLQGPTGETGLHC